MFHNRHGRHGSKSAAFGTHPFHGVHDLASAERGDLENTTPPHNGPRGRGFSLHALWHGAGRPHRGGGHFGGRGRAAGFGGFGGDDGDGKGFARGRKFSSDDLQLLLLDLINAEPSHGYELIKALQTRSNGFYSPSPGMVYPALTYLEELGYVLVQLEGNRKCYSLSDTGREFLAAHRERVDHMFARLAHIAERMDMVRRAMAGEEPLDPSAGGWLPEFHDARHALRHALGNVHSADEQRRITAILQRATAEILAGAQAADGDTA